MKRIVLTFLTLAIGGLFLSSLTPIGVALGVPLVLLGAYSTVDGVARGFGRGVPIRP
ncbi:hypothetical protein [Halegenticoccus tardaugens]|uniref:hypothetical protein n=1 Tax=Halegenticoccus tardaugens TaxID=2071624 RepID=UPI0013E95FD8|nr:hypothetical protein [Halegenticoccus tardaugens]